MKNLLKKIIKLFFNLKNGIKRFPETGVLSILFVINGIILNRRPVFYKNSKEIFEHLMFVISLGLPVSTYGKLLYEKFKKKRLRIITNLFLGILLILFYFTIPDNLNQKFFIRFSFLIIAEIVGLILIYTHDKKNPSLIILSLINKFAITVLFSAAIYFGISASIFTVDKLFELSINHKIYMDFYISVVGLFSVNYFLSIIPEVKREYKIKNYPVVFKKLFFYIGIPLILIYLVILYLYFIKIFSGAKFPINMVGHLVMWYGFITTLVMFFIYKIKEENKYISKFYKYFPYLMIIPLGMLFLAIGKRIYKFGFTPDRYFVLITGIWVALSMVVIAFIKKRKQIFILVSAFILILLSIYGPINSFFISKISQEKRFGYYLKKYELIKNNKITKNNSLNRAQKREISQFISFFKKYNFLNQIEILPEDFSKKNMNEVFGFYYVSKYSSSASVRYNFYKNDSLSDISSYNYYIKTRINFEQSKLINESLKFDYISKSKKLRVIKDQNILAEIDIMKLIKEYDKDHDKSARYNIKEATKYYENKEVKIMIIVQNLNYRYSDESGYMTFDLFLNIK